MNPVSNSFLGNHLPATDIGAGDRGALDTVVSDFARKLEQLNAASEQQVQSVGQEFESVFVSLLLKEMRNTLDTGEGGLFGSEQSDTFGGMFDQFMGQHLSEASPLGISDAITSYLKNMSLGQSDS